MSGMMDGVSKYWIMRADRGLDIQGCSGPYEAAWCAGVWSQGYTEESEQHLRDAIGELERAVVDLKKRVVEDYDLQSYYSIPPAGTPVDQKIYNEVCQKVQELTDKNAELVAINEALEHRLGDPE